VLLFRLALVAWMRSEELTDVTGRLRNVTVAADGLQVKLAGLSFGKDEIVPVLLALVGGTPDSGAAAPCGQAASPSSITARATCAACETHSRISESRTR